MFERNSHSDSDRTDQTSIRDDQSNSQPAQNTQRGIAQFNDVSAFVGENVEFEGTINYKGTVRIDGRLTGEIHTEGTLIVGQSAVVAAKVEAGTVVCQGKLVGDIVARENIQLMSPAVLDGSVKTPSLSMEEGVLFNGTCVMSSKSEAEARASSSEAFKRSLSEAEARASSSEAVQEIA